MKAHSIESRASRDGNASAKKNIEAIYPLSPLQQGMLFHSVREPGSGVYVTQFECAIEGEIDHAAFDRAWQQVIDRHAALRTGFFWQRSGEPVQIVSRRVPFAVDVQDWRQVPTQEQPSRWQTLVQEDRHRGFNLEAAPLMRGNMVQVANECYRFLWTCHHILLDGWSLPLVLREVFAFYEAYAQGRKLELESPRPYRDFIAWLRRQDGAEAEQYWREQLAGFDTPVKLPVDRFVGEAPTGYLTETLQLPTSKTRELQALAQSHGLTVNTIVQAAWALLLSRLTGAKDIVFGVTVSGRPTELSGVEDIVGLFINTLPLRVRLDPAARLVDMLQQLQAQNATLRQYDFVPLVDLQRLAELPLGEPLFDNILVFENFPLDEGMNKQRLTNLKIADIQTHEQTNYPLTVVVVPGDSLRIRIIYDRQRFQGAAIDRVLAHLGTLLAGMTANPQSRISDLSVLTSDEREQLLVTWNLTELDYPAIRCVGELFEKQAARTPEATAVIFEEQSLTYAELNARANQLAHHLRMLGVEPDVRVAICVERSPEMVVGLLGILKAGGAYVPLDPAYPDERLTFMLEDAQAAVLVTTAALAAELPVSSATLLCLDQDWGAIGKQSEHNPSYRTEPQHLGYVIYTSGSTGRPKGVSLTQAALINLLYWQRDASKAAADKTLQFTSLSFDVSFQEIFGTLATGGNLVLVSEAVRRDFDQLVAVIQEKQIQRIFLPFVALNNLAETVGDGATLPLKEVITAGEQLKVSEPIGRFFSQLPGCRLYNQYGPSESHVVSQFPLTGDPKQWPDTPPIGCPIANTQLYILDREFNPVPVGVAGELYIGGVQLARGYLNRSDLTAERFVPSPYADTPGTRLYKTGDLARFLPDGNIEFLGRIDHQVKLRGFRIELGEIETTLAQQPAVREAVVLAREDQPGDKRLAAYVVAAADTECDASALRAALKGVLPEYMVPAAFVVLEALPLTPNGKVDRKALPAPEGQPALAHDYVAPRTPTEQTLAEIWAEVLGTEQVGIHDNFFELGGHSLLVTQVVSRIRAAFEVELPLRALFEAPTAAELAHAVEAARHTGDGLQAPPIVPVARDTDLPLSFAQQRLWFLDQLTPNDPFYNMPGVVRLQGALDATALEGSLNALIARHEALRTTFCTVDGEAVQVISAELKLTIPPVDLTEVSAEARETKARALAAEEAQRPFDLATGPLLRAQLLRLAEDDHLLQVTFHHIVSDGWSLGVFIEELTTLYRAFAAGEPSPLAPLPIQYADFAHWQRQWLQGEVLDQQLAYWREQLQGLPALLELPTDRPRPAIQTFRGARHPITLPSELTQALHALSREAGASLFMTLLAAFQVLLARYSGQDDFAVGTPIANRNRTETEGLIGFFVNTLVLRATLSDNPSFRDLLARIKETTLGAYAHQDLPFERLVDELHPQRDMSHAPLFQVMFALQNAPLHALELPGLRLTPWMPESGTAKFDLTLDLTEADEALTGTLEYNTDLFEAATIARLVEHYITLLEGIVQTPQAQIAELPLVTAAEGQQLLVDWNATAVAYRRDLCLHELFAAQVEKTPQATALVFEDRSLTYAELNSKANQLARHLHTLGVGPDAPVGVCMERSLEMVVALYAILKAGGAYVPLDPEYPKDRLGHIMAGAELAVVLTQGGLEERLPPSAARVLALDEAWARIAQAPASPPISPVTPENLAYVIYTSGSTGRPKGVAVSHASIVNRLLWMQDEYGLEASDRVLQKTPFSFDVSVWEFFWPLLNGACLVVAKPGGHRDSAYLAELMTREAITTLHFVPPMLGAFLEEPGSARCRSLRRVICSGEALPLELVQRHYARLSAPLHNLYGPTEAAVDVSYWACDPQTALATVPIGRPVANTQLYILDTEFNPVPVGVAGELYIGGVQLARGYLNRPDLTAEKFIPDPFSETPGARLYKTGDLSRFLPDGNIEFLGRIDHQVKIRGFRIELGEIEAVLAQHPAVREAVVLAREDHPGDTRLAAYVVAAPDTDCDLGALRAALKGALPEYMVPAAFVVLEALPLTPNGKVNRKALPAPELTLAHDYVAPRTPTEQTLAEIWAEVLGVERVGIDDNFFELGGHSLLAVQLIAAIERRLGQILPLATLFHTPTIEQLSANLEQASGVRAWSPLVPIKPQGARAPFFCVPGADGSALSLQQLAHHLGPDQPFYGLQAAGLDGRSEPLNRVEDMADLYINAIKSLQPQGPYLVGGYSFGGKVAFEMALQLLKRGDKVQQLVIIDTEAPQAADSSQLVLDDLDFFSTIGGALERLWGVELQLSALELAGLSSEQQVEYLYQALKAVDVLPADLGKTQLAALTRVMKTNSRIQYAPAEKCSQRLTLLRASETCLRATEDSYPQMAQDEDATLGWRGWCDGPVEVQFVPGDHSTMMAEPHVSALAEKLQAVLATSTVNRAA